MFCSTILKICDGILFSSRCNEHSLLIVFSILFLFLDSWILINTVEYERVFNDMDLKCFMYYAF